MNRHPLIISSPYPNGVTYPLNMLAHLQLPIYTNSFAAFWRKRGGEYHLNPLARFRYGQWFSRLQDQIPCQADITPLEWSHEWPTPQALKRPIILFVRDGRDALYSEYRRRMPEVTISGFQQFLQHQQHQDQLTPPERWALFYHLWQEALTSESSHYLVMQFEAIKTDPKGELQRLLKFLDLMKLYDPSLLEEAIAESDTQKVKQTVDQQTPDGHYRWKTLRAGLVQEWRKSWTGISRKGIPSLFPATLRQFHYDDSDFIAESTISIPQTRYAVPSYRYKLKKKKVLFFIVFWVMGLLYRLPKNIRPLWFKLAHLISAKE